VPTAVAAPPEPAPAPVATVSEPKVQPIAPSAPALAKTAPSAAPPRVAKPAAVVPKPVPAPTPNAPSVQVERTRWHPTAARRVAWVQVGGLAGTREVHEGDVAGTLVVKEIRPSGVVFQHGDTTLERRVGD
jgi:hypothetical protein